jgi:AAT family amino acid transporter
MLYNLAENNEAPKSFGKLNKNGVPSFAVIVTGAALLIGVILNYLVPGKVFTWVTAISTFGAVWTWAMILISQMRYRKSLSPEESRGLKYKMPLYPFTSYFSLAFLLLVIGLMAYFPDTRIALIVGPLWLGILVAAYYGSGLHKKGKKEENTIQEQVG